MNYGELRAAIANFLQRSDPEMTASIPTWVTLATAVFNRDLRTPEMESRDTAAMTSEFIGLPSDFLEMRGVYKTDGTALRYLAAQQFAEVVSLQRAMETPIYTIEDFQLRLYPPPSASAPASLTILYYERIPMPTSDSATNWLMRDWPDVYLYGSMMHARAWLHDDPRLALVKQLYDEALASVRRRKVHATGIVSAVGSDIPAARLGWSIRRGI
ncbi:MAG: hypothetical protein VKL39_16540 [Leptolyngbyaceae bacterium]|nr:hypothetical protein [Leptolyngbyaceae bacterium]